MLFSVSLQAMTLHPEPVVICFTPDTILPQLVDTLPVYAGKRSRYATCSGVQWLLDSSHFATVGLLDRKIRVYSMDEQGACLQQVFSHPELNYPEKLAFSPDGSSCVICNAGSICFFPVRENKVIEKTSYIIRQKNGSIVHDVAFSNDGRYFSYVTLDPQGTIHLCKKEKELYEVVQTLASPVLPLKPKTIAFSPDCKFVIIGFCLTVSQQVSTESRAVLAVFSFDSTRGEIGKFPISQSSWMGGLEGLALSPDGTTIYSADQVCDTIMSSSFNASTGEVGSAEVALSNPESRLSFPHSLSFSPNGKFLAVTNYGDDKVTIYKTIP
jgi:WD40 repeat protein